MSYFIITAKCAVLCNSSIPFFAVSWQLCIAYLLIHRRPVQCSAGSITDYVKWRHSFFRFVYNNKIVVVNSGRNGHPGTHFLYSGGTRFGNYPKIRPIVSTVTLPKSSSVSEIMWFSCKPGMTPSCHRSPLECAEYRFWCRILTSH
jgi:hypothetical protein